MGLASCEYEALVPFGGEGGLSFEVFREWWYRPGRDEIEKDEIEGGYGGYLEREGNRLTEREEREESEEREEREPRAHQSTRGGGLHGEIWEQEERAGTGGGEERGYRGGYSGSGGGACRRPAALGAYGTWGRNSPVVLCWTSQGSDLGDLSVWEAHSGLSA